MIRTLILTGSLIALAACATAPVTSASGTVLNREEQQVVAAAEALFRAMETRDTSALRDLFLPEGRVVSLRTGGAAPASPRIVTAEGFVAGFARPGQVVRERMWSPQVNIDGDLASLWARYDLYQGDEFSHCGVDTFHFVRIREAWKILSLSYTVRPEGCESAPGS